LLCFGEASDLKVSFPVLRQICRTVEVVQHALTSLSSGTDYLRRLRALPSALPYAAVRFRSEAMQGRVRAWLRDKKIDAVLCETPYPLINFPPSLPVPLIVNTHNIEHVLLERYLAYERNPAKRAYAWLEFRKLRRWEQYACSRASLVMVCSEHDRSAMKQLCPGEPVAVAPNVIDVDSYNPTSHSKESTVLFVGGMDWYPNRDAVKFFVSAILPLLRQLVPGVRFVVAGRNPSPGFRRQFSAHPQVEFTGTVPDMRPVIAEAAVCVVPLRIGSGTRLKILEQAAMQKPIVSTRLGAEGLGLVEGKEILFADDSQAFAQAVAGLLTEPSRCRALGRAARLRVERQYSLPVLRMAVRRALAEMVEGRARFGWETEL